MVKYDVSTKTGSFDSLSTNKMNFMIEPFLFNHCKFVAEYFTQTTEHGYKPHTTSSTDTNL